MEMHRSKQDINTSSWPTPGTFASFDGGKTWQDNGALPLPRGEKGGGDVTVDFSSQGTGFVASNAGANWQVNSVLVWRTENGGKGFSQPIEVSQDRNQTDCFQPQIVVTQQGIVYISYFKLVHGRVNVFLAKSTTHGASFQSIQQVSTTSFDPSLGDQHREKGGWIGDYQGLATGNENVYPFWNDTRTGHMGIFTTLIQGNAF